MSIVLRRGQMALLPHQIELLEQRAAKIRVLQGGYRSGKTVAGVAAVVDMGFRSEGHPILVLAPTYRLIRDVFIEEAMRRLDEWKLPHKLHKSDAVLTIGGRHFSFKVICRSAEKPRSTEGLTVGGLLVDEWELCSVEALMVAIARVSIGPCLQIVLTGTAEGYGPAYDLILKKPDAGTWVKSVNTGANTKLPPGYVATLRKHMDADTAGEKIDGVRRAKGGRTYSRFDRSIHGTVPCVPTGTGGGVGGGVQVWADFNVSHMTWVVAEVDRDRKRAHIIGELIGPEENDTEKQAAKMKIYLADYFTRVRGVRCTPEDVARMKLHVYCDASGSARNAVTPQTHLTLLRQAGFKPKSGGKNPLVANRVNTVQVMLMDRRLTIDVERAPWTTTCFENQKNVDGVPDKSSNLDHALDAIGYGCHWQFPVERRPGDDDEA